MRIQTISFLLLLLVGLSLSSCHERSQDKQYVIGFSQCTAGDAWRKAMHEEMKRELSFHPNLELIIKDAKNSNDKQVGHIQEFIDQGVDLLIVSPNEAEPITPVVEKAFEKGIPVIVVDRRTSSSLYTAYVGANNYEIGKLAGDYVAKLLNGEGRIIEVWGLKGSSPAVDRHNGFKDALANYRAIKTITSVNGEWEKEVAKIRFSESYEEKDSIDLVFAHNDVMALGAYEYLRSIDKQRDLKFIGIDGLGGLNGGLQFVDDGILDATFLYPTGGAEVVRLANRILHHEPYEKENLLSSTVIDGRNVHIMRQQTNKILNQQKNIERQQERITEQIKIYRTQRTLLYILLGGLVVIIVLGALALLALREKHEINKALTLKNREIIKQRNEIAKMAKKADKATEAKFKFFTNISHEFRTPLTLILSPVEDMLKGDVSFELKKDLNLIRKNAVRLLKLVNQLMDFRKIESQKMVLQAAERDVLIFIKDIANSFDRLALSREINFSVKTELKELKLYFDANKLDKVLFNLLSNAFKFTKDGGKIILTVELTDAADMAVITVEDDGKGMSPEDVNFVFDRFFSGTTQNDLSTGLGLALSKEFVKLHKGEITVVSEKWKGTKFVITLPLGRKHLKESEIVRQDEKALPVSWPGLLDFDEEIYIESYELEEGQQQKEHTLLIIEDNEELRGFLKKRLLREFNVVEAPNGSLGLNQAFENIPDLIICDVMLPVKNGLEVTATLKHDLRTSHIPIIQLTAKDAEEQKIEGVQSGADLYVTKPFSYQYLYERIKGLIKSREILKEHYNSEIALDPQASVPGQLDKKFINEFTAIVQRNLANPDLNANEIATNLGMSRVQVYRKVKALIGYSVNDYVINVRLKKAKHLLLHSDMNISQIAYEVGFSSPAYFSTAFKNHFNVSPTDFKVSRV